MSENYIKSGVKLTADVDEFDRKMSVLSDKMSRTLTKAQKEAGIHKDLQGNFINRQGKLVEGLTLTQVRLGQYVDELGKVRTVEGQYVADLNKIEQALGFYANAMGEEYKEGGAFQQERDKEFTAAP